MTGEDKDQIKQVVVEYLGLNRISPLDIVRYIHSIRNMDGQVAISALAALAHETRLDVFRVLVQAGRAGLPAGGIAAQLELPSATLSFHLKELKSSGLIQCERHGTSRIYSPDLSAVNELIAFLTANCCRGVDGITTADGECDLISGTPC